MPSLKGYVEKFQALPECLTASLAFYIAFYRGVRLDEKGFVGLRGEQEYPISDDKSILEFYNAHRKDDAQTLAKAVLSNMAFWGEDLTEIPGLEKAVAEDLKTIDEKGAYELMKGVLK